MTRKNFTVREAAEEFVPLVNAYLDGEIMLLDFAKDYQAAFANIEYFESDELYECLVRFFSDVEVCTTNKRLQASNPQLYITEVQLRSSAKELLRNIKRMNRT